MCHPKMVENKIVDCCRNINLDKQFNKLNKYKDI